jgi:diketogulonate reductase-like aldo/keto reductase
MNIPTKRLHGGFELPVYGLGLWQMGGRWEADSAHDDKEITAIRAALDAGITHIDTAESYGNGHAEELLGRAMSGYDRSRLIIATKVSAAHQRYDDVHRAFAASLRRIGTDYIDLYLLHRFPEPGIAIADTMRALDELVDQGLVKHVGVSNMTPNRLAQTQKHTKHKLVCNQVHYNVEYREIEDKGVLKYCQEQDIFLVAWRPLQKGLLAGSSFLDQLVQKYHKSPAQIALNWLITQESVVTVSKTSSLAHLQENLGALDWTMEPEDVERIRASYPDQKRTSDAVPLDYPADITP